MKKTINELKEWGASRETSWEVAQAIFEVAGNEEEAQQIWEETNQIWANRIYFDEIKKRAIEINKQNRQDECLCWGEERISTEPDEMQEFTDSILENYPMIKREIERQIKEN